jgi:nucleoside-diphosphate-sugar epimerase
MKSILIIGGSGNIGFSLTKKLSKYYKIHCISRNRKIILPNVVFSNFNYRKKSEIKKLIKERYFDYIINLIIYNKQQAKNEIEYFSQKTKNYIYISSTSIYNQTKNRINEKSLAVDSRWPVAKEKIECEKIFFSEYRKNKFPITIIRAGHIYNNFTFPTNIIGLGNNLINLLKKGFPALLFNKKAKRTLMHSQDFAEALYQILNSKKNIKGEIINIAGKKIISWEILYKIYFKYLKIQSKFKIISTSNIRRINKKIYYALIGDRNKNTIYDLTKLKKFAPNFKEKITLQEGLKNVIKYNIRYYKKNKKFKFYKKIYEKL